MSKRPYSYAVMRYIHDVVTGEFVNVGLLLYAPRTGSSEPEVRFEFKDRIGRIKGMFPNVDRRAFSSSMRALRRRAVDVSRELRKPDLYSADIDAYGAALKVLPRDGSSLQWAVGGTGIASDLDAAFNRIADRMLSQYDHRSASRTSDDDVWRPVQAELAKRNVLIEFQPQVIAGEIDSIEFRHSWRNGVIHAYEPLSFDLADAENIKDKARRWRGHLSSVVLNADQVFQAYFIAGAPSDESLIPAYNAALTILRTVSPCVKVYEDNELAEFVNHIEDEFRHHEHGGDYHVA